MKRHADTDRRRRSARGRSSGLCCSVAFVQPAESQQAELGITVHLLVSSTLTVLELSCVLLLPKCTTSFFPRY